MKFQDVWGAKRCRAPAREAPGSHRVRVLPGGTHAKEIYAAAVLTVLAATAVTGWFTASAQPAPEPAAPATPPQGYEFASNAVYTGSITGATALILIALIAGAAVVGMLLCAPTPPRPDADPDNSPRRPKRMRPRRSGAAS